MTDCG